MKPYRCCANFQGDKCRLSQGHGGFHTSPLHVWTDGEELIELKPPSMRRALKDQRSLLAMEPAIRKRMLPLWLVALKNCEKYVREAIDVRNERSPKRHQNQAQPTEQRPQA